MYPESCPPLKSMGISKNIDKNFERRKSLRLIEYAYILMIKSPKNVPATVMNIVTAYDVNNCFPYFNTAFIPAIDHFSGKKEKPFCTMYISSVNAEMNTKSTGAKQNIVNSNKNSRSIICPKPFLSCLEGARSALFPLCLLIFDPLP